MEFFLAFIGFCFLLYFASKGLNRVGDVFNGIAKRMEDRSLSAVQLRHDQEKALSKLQREVKKLQAVRKNEEYEDRVRKEIDELTK